MIVPFGFVPNTLTPPSPRLQREAVALRRSFTGLACSEPRLIELAYAFEQASKKRVPPGALSMHMLSHVIESLRGSSRRFGAWGLAAFALYSSFATDLVAADWPQWRGPRRDGISAETGLLASWPKEGPRQLWTVNGLGEGYSTVSVAGGRAYTQGQRGAPALRHGAST